MSLPIIRELSTHWTGVLRQNFTSWKAFADFLELTEEQRAEIDSQSAFPLNVPLRLAEKMKKGTLKDPILLQFLPLKAKVTNDTFCNDPVNDQSFTKTPRLLQKYEGRVLLVLTGACAMNCRYCFRQNFPYSKEEKIFERELEIIRQDDSIQEVILSGGDPLMLSDRILKALFTELEKIAHVKRIRLHTRMPIGIPERLDEDFLSIMETCSKQLYFVLHINHASELDEEILGALLALRKCGAILLNQSVLLKDVNDSVLLLKQLSEVLVNNGIIPYYLHQLDPVSGAEGFEVAEEEGRKLIQDLQANLSGYAVPRYVREIPGQLSKTLL